MDNRMLTYELIINSFKKLVIEMGFQKITVKMIAAESGIMRSTFYNYFQDKYEILEWILDEDLFGKIAVSVERKKYSDALRDMFRCFDEEKPFYRKAFEITGQNGFEEILISKLTPMFAEEFRSVDSGTGSDLVTSENMAYFQSHSLVMFLKVWLCENRFGSAPADDVCEAFVLLSQGISLIKPSSALASLAAEIKKAFKI